MRARLTRQRQPSTKPSKASQKTSQTIAQTSGPLLPGRRRALHTALWLCGAAFFASVVVAFQMQLWRADWTVPFHYKGDALFHGMLIKGLKDNAWALHNALLGAPGQQMLHDFPKSYGAQFIGLKLLAWLSSNYAEAMNGYYLLTYPLIMVVSCAVFVSFGLSRTAAFLSSSLFTFLPFHLSRGENHLLLSAYVSVPLAAWLVVRVHGKPLFGEKRRLGDEQVALTEDRSALPQRRWYRLGPWALALFIASSGVYYAYFAIVLLLVSGGSAWSWDRRRAPAIAALALAGGIALGVAVNLTPSFAYWHQHGANPGVVDRHSGEPEINGLKISELLLPATDHRLPALAALKARYLKHAPLVTENDDATLGIVGSVGFLFLLGLLVDGRSGERLPRWLRVFMVVNLAALLLGTIGGFSSLVSLAGFTAIRSYTRISVFIAFFALGAAGYLLDRLRAHPRVARSRAFTVAVVSILLAIGLLDQTPTSACPDYDTVKMNHRADGAFVQSVEQLVPPRAMIFQIPYIPFPEPPSSGGMDGYTLARGYLHSRNLRWSFGAMKGREDDRWQRETVKLPVADMVTRLRQAGFAGIYLDLAGYVDGGRAIAAQLDGVLGRPSVVSPARGLAFYAIPALPH